MRKAGKLENLGILGTARHVHFIAAFREFGLSGTLLE
jgi:hypothetical protein